MIRLPSIDIIIPTLNEEMNLQKCLDAIFQQDYEKGSLKVTIVDGGSADSTVLIAKQYGCDVLLNEEKLAEPGVAKGIINSKSDLCCVLAVDNIIANKGDFFKKLVRPFMEQNVAGAFPIVIYDYWEPSINKYINESAEPFTEFVYMNACNTRTFHLVYKELFKNETYVIYNFKDKTPPLLALAQGFTIRRENFKITEESKYYDLIPIMQLINSGQKLAYVVEAEIYHYQIMNIKSFIKKFKWRIKRNLIYMQKKNYDFFSLRLKIRRILWPIYAISIISPFLYSLYKCFKKKKMFYIYHFIGTIVLIFLIIQEYLKIKLQPGNN